MEEFKHPSHTDAAARTTHIPLQTVQSKESSRLKKIQLANLKNGKWLWPTILVVIILLASTTVFFVHRYNNSQAEVKRLSNPSEAAKLEQGKLIGQIGQLTLLPQGETPTIATVSDASKLQSQNFFVSAHNGDKVLIYTKAKQAYLYRPSTNKIINIAPVNLGDSTSSSTPTPAKKP